MAGCDGVTKGTTRMELGIPALLLHGGLNNKRWGGIEREILGSGTAKVAQGLEGV